jgi:hypothetical protein
MFKLCSPRYPTSAFIAKVERSVPLSSIPTGMQIRKLKPIDRGRTVAREDFFLQGRSHRSTAEGKFKFSSKLAILRPPRDGTEPVCLKSIPTS